MIFLVPLRSWLRCPDLYPSRCGKSSGKRASRGEPVTALAEVFGLSPRTVRHLLRRCRERGGTGLIPGYRAPKAPDHAHPEAVRQAVLALRRDHPTWGAELIRVMLVEAQPQMIGPSPQAIRRWIRAAGLVRAPAGRRVGARSARAREPHQTWQIDASEHIPLADKAEACWLRIVDEATGAVLRTDVFPPRVLDPGRPASDSGQLEAGVPALGPARAAAGRQRGALGISGRPAHRPGLLAGRAGRGGDGQSAALPPGQWGGRAVARGRQAVGRALDLRVECRVAGAAGCHGSRATRALSGEGRAVPPGSLSRPEPFGTGLRPRPGRIDLGPSKGLGPYGHASRATPGGPAGASSRCTTELTASEWRGRAGRCGWDSTRSKGPGRSRTNKDTRSVAKSPGS